MLLTCSLALQHSFLYDVQREDALLIVLLSLTAICASSNIKCAAAPKLLSPMAYLL